MQKTGIDWADYVWNPVTGCSPVSRGCDNCQAAESPRGRGGKETENAENRD